MKCVSSKAYNSQDLEIPCNENWCQKVGQLFFDKMKCISSKPYNSQYSIYVMEMGVKKWVNIVCTSKFGPTGVAAGGAEALDSFM